MKASVDAMKAAGADEVSARLLVLFAVCRGLLLPDLVFLLANPDAHPFLFSAYCVPTSHIVRTCTTSVE